MFQHVNPAGISVSQAKKDAKKLAKNQDISLSQAQDKIAFKHSRSTWAQAMAQMNQKISINIDGNDISFPMNASMTFVSGITGTGKSVLLYEIITQLLQSKIPVTFITMGLGSLIPDSPYHSDIDKRFHKLIFDKTNMLTVLDYEKSKSDLGKITLNGGVLIVDEVFFVLRNNPKEYIQDLLLNSKHTILSCQSLLDLEPYVPKTLCSSESLQLFMAKGIRGDLDRLKLLDGLPKEITSEMLSNEFKLIRNEMSSFLYGRDNHTPIMLKVYKKHLSF